MNRRDFMRGSAACAVAAVVPLPAGGGLFYWVDVPGTDLAIKGSAWVVAGWQEVFAHGRDGVTSEFMSRLLTSDWVYITSPNYREPADGR